MSEPIAIFHNEGELHHLEFQPLGYAFPILLKVDSTGEKPNTWAWNGSVTKPTLRPSILTVHADGTISHLYLTDGICTHLADSTDGLAGKVLPLPPPSSL